MNKLVLMCGFQGAGKSSFIKNNDLGPYTISSDAILASLGGPVYDPNTGKIGPNMGNLVKAWEILYEMLERRMAAGEFVVVDATNIKPADVAKYKPLASKYGYDTYAVDFRYIPIEEVIARNNLRPDLYRVPEETIRKNYASFGKASLPSFVKMLKPETAMDALTLRPSDFSSYTNVHVIGDLQGCFTPLKKYIDTFGAPDESNLFIFVGDYLDRGNENGEVLRWVLDNRTNKNIIFLEGNHESHLRSLISGTPVRSREFLSKTLPQITAAGFTNDELADFIDKLQPMSYFSFGNKKVIITHAGVSNIPNNLNFFRTRDLIFGYGPFSANIGDAFLANTSDSWLEIHGHRNPKGVPVDVQPYRLYNLEGRVEFQGDLRAVLLNMRTLDIMPVEIPNPRISLSRELSVGLSPEEVIENSKFIEDLRSSDGIRERKFGNISSFSFTRETFAKKNWNTLTTRARGLYINTSTFEIVTRAYDKFFTIDEVPSVSTSAIENTWKFPISVYAKENGYLGLVGYDSSMGELILSSKNSMEGDYADNFTAHFNSLSKDTIDSVRELAANRKVSFLFEVTDMQFDPHIIKYPPDQPALTLLDITYRKKDFEKISFDSLLEIGEKLNLSVKTLVTQLASPAEYLEWQQDQHKNWDETLEGYVLESSDGSLAKVKLPYYTFWKSMRGMLSRPYNSSNGFKETGNAEVDTFIKYAIDKYGENLSTTPLIDIRDAFEDEFGKIKPALPITYPTQRQSRSPRV